MKQNYTRLLPQAAKSIEFNKFLQYNQPKVKNLNIINQKNESPVTQINRFAGHLTNFKPIIGMKMNRQVQSDDDSMVSDSMRG